MFFTKLGPPVGILLQIEKLHPFFQCFFIFWKRILRIWASADYTFVNPNGKTSVCREKVVVVTTIVARKKIVLGHNIFERIGLENSGRTHCTGNN